MKAEASLDMRQFQRDLNALAERTSRTLPEFLNARAYFLAKKAMEFTDKADRDKIEALGLKSTQTKSGRRRFVFERENAIAYYLAMRGKKEGKNPGWIGRQFESRTDLARAARRFISGKLRAIGFLKSGWLAPLRLFSRYASGGRGIRVEGYSERGARKSAAIAAKRGPRTEATLINNVTPLDYVTGAVRTVARSMQERALTRAFASEHAEMRAHLKKKLAEEYQRLGATVR